MKHVLLFLFCGCLAAAGAQSASQKKAAPVRKSAPAKKAAAPAGPLKVPADARMIEPNTYRWTDPKTRKQWIYRETPFGVRRYEEEKTQAAAPVVNADITAVEDGESIRFTRPSPFGNPVTWTRPKSELTAEEQAIWKRVQDSRAAAAGQQE